MIRNKAFFFLTFFLVLLLTSPGLVIGSEGNSSSITGNIIVNRPPLQLAPSAPTELTASCFPDTLSMGLNWKDNSSNETGFTIQRKAEDSAFTTLTTTAANATSYFDDTVANDCHYTYRVCANGTLSNSSYSNEASWITGPYKPANFKVSLNSSTPRITLYWDDTNIHETQYKITKKTATSATQVTVEPINLAVDAETYLDEDVKPGIRYTYSVIATGQGGSQATAEESIRFLAAPSNLVVIYPPDSTEMALRWQDNCNEEAGFLLQRSFGPDSNPVSFEIAPNTIEYSDEYREDSMYMYQIKARSGQSDTQDSNFTSVYTWYSPPRMPQGFEAEALSSSEIKLSWPDSSKYETGFNITRVGNNIVTPIKVPANTMTYIDKGLMPNTNYRYTITAVNQDSKTSSLPLTRYATTKPGVSKPDSDIFSKVEAVLQIGNPNMIINGESKEIDPGKGTAPVIVEGRTLVPVKAIMDAVGGTLAWDDTEKRVTIGCNGQTVELWIGSNATRVNGSTGTTDVAPQIMNDRTMLPIGFISQNLGLSVTWQAETNQVVIKTGTE
ncbi:MAG: stalk domain-containing protein [Syntrophomonadaceae bacterium]